MFDRIICVLVRIKVRGHLVMSIIQFMNLTSMHFWTYLNFPAVANLGNFPCQMERLFPSRSKLAISLVDQNKQIQQNRNFVANGAVISLERKKPSTSEGRPFVPRNWGPSDLTTTSRLSTSTTFQI